MFNLNQLRQATTRINKIVSPTLLNRWSLLCQQTGCEVWVKHENHTPTTAFKVRGGINYIHEIMASGRKVPGLISATRGNHGQSLSFACAREGLPITIVVPECNSIDQNKAIQAWGGKLVIHGEDFEAARKHAAYLQGETGLESVASFDPILVLGVASYALEMFSMLKDLDTVYVPIGMGSGVCGLIKTRDLLGLKTKIVGVVSEGAPTFSLSFEAGRIIPTDSVNTIADGVATSSPVDEAFDMIKKGAERVVMVSDLQIKQAMLQYYQATHNLAEGAGAISLAALNSEKEKMQGKKVGVILSGGMIDIDRFIEYIRAC